MKYEYFVLRLSEPMSVTEVENLLCFHGQKEWELVNAIVSILLTSPHREFYFKRPIK